MKQWRRASGVRWLQLLISRKQASHSAGKPRKIVGFEV
jgi:hypothetical protein